MKTIEQTAIENYFEFEQQSAFKDGAEFAQRWIPVEEELPEDLTDLLIRLSNGQITIGCLRDNTWGYNGWRSDEIKVTHWRYIDLV